MKKTGKRLKKESSLDKRFTYSSPKQAFSAVSRIGRISEKHNHHPKIILDGKKVTVKSITHDKGRVTEKDRNLIKEIEMNKTAILNEIYKDSFSEEFEKISFNIGAMAKKVWTPFAAKPRGGDFSKIYSSLDKNYSNIVSNKQRLADIASRQARTAEKLTGAKKDVSKYEKSGLLEKVLGGRFGTGNKRIANLEGAKKRYSSAKAVQSRQRNIYGKEYKSIKSDMTRSRKNLSKAQQDLNYAAEPIMSNAARVGNMASRVGLVGGGGYLAGSAIGKMNQDRGY